MSLIVQRLRASSRPLGGNGLHALPSMRAGVVGGMWPPLPHPVTGGGQPAPGKASGLSWRALCLQPLLWAPSEDDS